MKRLLSITLITLMVIVSLAGTVLASAPTFTLESKTVDPGETFTLTMSISADTELSGVLFNSLYQQILS